MGKDCECCGTDISKRGNRAVRCEHCQCAHREAYQKAYRIVTDMPSSARAKIRYYRLWKFMKDEHLTPNDLQMLFLKRKSACRYATPEEIICLRTEMKIIGEVYKALISKDVQNYAENKR